jgi:endogenous inhibitor of DNA gyrase (YacG/DUF329 family)
MQITHVSCPTCQKKIIWSAAAVWRPFCSERCKLIDLGAWASDKYRVAGRTEQDTSLSSDQPEDTDR